VTSLEATVQAKRDAAEKLRSFAGRCPLAPELIACRLSGQEVTELANQLAAEINTVDQEILSQDTEYVSLEAAIQALQQQINSLEQARAKLPHPAGRAGRSPRAEIQGAHQPPGGGTRPAHRQQPRARFGRLFHYRRRGRLKCRHPVDQAPSDQNIPAGPGAGEAGAANV